MVIIHVAHIDTSIIGGVQFAVPKMVRAQSNFAKVALINTLGHSIDGIQELTYNGCFQKSSFPHPFDSPDLVIFHEVYRFEFIKIYKEVQNSNIPYIVIPHGCLSHQAQKRKFLKKSIANICFFNGFLNSATFIQYLSENEAQMSAFPHYGSIIQHNGIQLPIRKKEVFFKDGITLVYIGRLEIKTKGIDLLISAVKDCCTFMREANVRIYIYGPDYDNSHGQLKDMIEKAEVSDLVHVDKEKLGVDKENVLLSADGFIQTSRTEGLPLGPLEALSYGLPCIVTDGVGLGNLIVEYCAGYLCETSSNGIATAIKQFVLNKDKIESMSHSAIELVEENFDQKIVAHDTIKKYHEMIENI